MDNDKHIGSDIKEFGSSDPNALEVNENNGNEDQIKETSKEKNSAKDNTGKMVNNISRKIEELKTNMYRKFTGASEAYLH